MRGRDGVLLVLRQILGRATMRIVGGGHLLVFGFPQTLRWLSDYVCCRSDDPISIVA
jgi:hypothetical protein